MSDTSHPASDLGVPGQGITSRAGALDLGIQGLGPDLGVQGVGSHLGVQGVGSDLGVRGQGVTRRAGA